MKNAPIRSSEGMVGGDSCASITRRAIWSDAGREGRAPSSRMAVSRSVPTQKFSGRPAWRAEITPAPSELAAPSRLTPTGTVEAVAAISLR